MGICFHDPGQDLKYGNAEHYVQFPEQVQVGTNRRTIAKPALALQEDWPKGRGRNAKIFDHICEV
jgi:hypothetical protein